MYLFVYFFDGLWPLEIVSLPPLHLCSFVCLVFHFRHTPRSREEAGKQQFEVLPQCLSLKVARSYIIYD